MLILVHLRSGWDLMNHHQEHDTVISDHLHIARRYARSIRIERDYRDPQSLEGYVITPTVHYALEQLLAGLRLDSSQRAWRITGPYGAGKSAFGVFTANLVNRSDPGHKIALSILKQVSKEFAATIKVLPRYLPIPITGSRARFGDVLLSSLVQALETDKTVGRNPSVLAEVKKYQQNQAEGQVEDNRAIQLIVGFAQYIKRSSLPYDGILILIDEMGKFLEYAAIRPGKTDAFLFQRLGELASGSSDVPLAVVGFLHHQFADYAIGYGQRAEEEWAKVSERFEEIPFDESPEQYAFLLASAIQNNISAPRRNPITDRATDLYRMALRLGISVVPKRHDDLMAVAPNLYPIHPATLVVLSSGIKRFGQNERSLFSFLLSHEPYAFQQFIATRPFHQDSWYRLSDLYDYLSSIGTIRFRDGDRRRRWDFLRSALTATPGLTETQQAILKTVGLINVLQPLNGLKADEQTVTFALRDTSEDGEIAGALLSLVRKSLLYQRNSQMDYCLWSNTSVDLPALYEEAERRIPPITDLEAFREGLPQSRPVLAHRHYHRTGTLRAFEIQYSTLGELERFIPALDSGGFDGQIIVVPVDSGQHLDEAKEIVLGASITKNPRVLIHLLEVTPGDLAVARELKLWQWIQDHCQELRVDEFARSEVKKRLDELSSDLEQRLSSLLGFDDSEISRKNMWIYGSDEIAITDRKSLHQRLSDICDDLYHGAPIIKNELINRTKLSSSIASARIKLIARMIENQKSENLGLTATPPELTIYLSLFSVSGLHRTEDGIRGFYPPTNDDPCHWEKVWHDLRSLLQQSGQISIEALLGTLERPPYGIRQGVSPLLLAAFILYYSQDVSLFERGTYIVQVTEHHFMRLLKSPRNFSLHFVPTESDKTSLLNEYWRSLDIIRKRLEKNPEVTDVVRELYKWVTSLSSYALKTQRISKTAQKVRATLLKSSDPMDLLYAALPLACGMETALSEGVHLQTELFLEKLNGALNELNQADQKLRSEIQTILADALQLGGTIAEVRARIQQEYLPFLSALKEYKLRAFLTRAADPGLSDYGWVDSNATLLAGRILPHWQDETLEAFRSEAEAFGGRLRRWISLMIGRIKTPPSNTNLASVTVTNSDGNETALAVLKKGKLPKRLQNLKDQLKLILSTDPSNASIVLAHVLAEFINDSDEAMAGGKKNGSADKSSTPHS